MEALLSVAAWRIKKNRRWHGRCVCARRIGEPKTEDREAYFASAGISCSIEEQLSRVCSRRSHTGRLQHVGGRIAFPGWLRSADAAPTLTEAGDFAMAQSQDRRFAARFVSERRGLSDFNFRRMIFSPDKMMKSKLITTIVGVAFVSVTAFAQTPPNPPNPPTPADRHEHRPEKKSAGHIIGQQLPDRRQDLNLSPCDAVPVPVDLDSSP
jgi:hypothetical protein